MAGRRHHFQGQFGINETSLTAAIENGKFELAEELILTTQDPTFLNDGPYENIPLHMVLTNNHHTDNSRNLRLAKLLVQNGANSNLRIPYGDLDRASPSPFEELVVYFEVLKSYVEGRSDILCEELDMYFELEEFKIEFITNTIDLNGIGCESTIDDCKKLVKHTSDLINVFLEHGSDPNVITTFGHKTLFHWVVEHQDLELAKRFLNTCRVNINLCDVHGNSPLMDTILRNDPMNSLIIYEGMCDTTDYINVNTQNCCGETALFRAVFVGAVDVASKLRNNGAKIESNVCLSQVPVSYSRDSGHFHQCRDSLLREVPPLTTPLLAPLLSDAPTRLRFTQVSSHTSVCNNIPPHKHLIDKILSSSISPLVDIGCLTSPIVAHETVELLALTNFTNLKEEKIAGSDFVSLMFGNVSSGLRQLCVRTLFDHVLITCGFLSKLWPNIQTHNVCSKECKEALTKDIISEIVEKLGIPKSFSIFFEIEAAKYQICKRIMCLESIDCDQACSESEESIFDDDNDDESFDSDDSSNNADSLFFFSSDILSEESSEELDDLSDEQLSGSNEDDFEGCADGRVNGGASKRNFEYETLNQSSSESENLEYVIESMCENIAEHVVCDSYQHENGELSATENSASEIPNSEQVTNVSISIFSESSNETITSSSSSNSPE